VRKGADPYLVAEQLLISPACGLGSIDPFLSEPILRLLNNLSGYIRSIDHVGGKNH